MLCLLPVFQRLCDTPKAFRYQVCIFYCVNHRCQRKTHSMNYFLPCNTKIILEIKNLVSSWIEPSRQTKCAKCGFHLLFGDLFDCAKVQVCQLFVISHLDESLASSKDPDVFYGCLLRLLFRNTKSNFEIN